MSDTTTEVLNRVKISGVYAALGGPKLRRSRGPAFWRGGDGFNVSLNDAKGTWYDHVPAEGGGLLDLIVRVRGGNRADALRWCADLAGVEIGNTPLSAEERERWARDRRALERDLPTARYWRRSALVLGEDVLDQLKVALFDPTLQRPEIGELQEWTARLALWRKLDGAALVAEYLEWLQHHPQLTTGMVRAARRLESAERRAITKYLALNTMEAEAA